MKIRREQLDVFAELQRRTRQRHLALQLVADDDRARIDASTGNVIFEDSRGNLSTVELTDQGINGLRTAEGRHFSFGRDEAGRIARITDPINHTVEIDHGTDGLIRELQRNGRSLLHCEYLEDGTILEATFADGAKERLEYTGPAEGQTCRIRHRSVSLQSIGDE